MIPQFQCPPDGPRVIFDSMTGEKYAKCRACDRCEECIPRCRKVR